MNKLREKRFGLSRSPASCVFDASSAAVPVRISSMLNEERLSRALGFALTPGSGCVEQLRKKGDGRTEDFVIECKETKSASIRITGDMLRKVYSEAKCAGKEPLMIVSVYGVESPTPCDWVLLPAYLLQI